MTINELHIQLDLQPENKIGILEDAATKCNEGYLFVDSNDGHCYLFDENGNEDDIKKIKSIKDYAFYTCKQLKSIEIPNSIKSIGNCAFEWCYSLKSIEIPDSVKCIGDYAFACCKNLKSIVILDSIKSIGYLAFACCESLKSLSFKGKTMDQVEEMENYPFGIKDESIIRCI